MNISITKTINPKLYHNGGRLTDIQEDENSALRISEVTHNRLKYHLEARMHFYKTVGDGDIDEREAPSGLVNNVLQRSKTHFPALRGVTGVPVFAEDGSLIDLPGFHEPSGIYYHPKNDVPALPEDLTDEHVEACRDELVDLIADFPLDGMVDDQGNARPMIQAAVANGDPVPSLCHALSAALTPITRNMVNGPSPGHLGRKDKPRTGATGLLRTMGYIGTLEVPVPMALPADTAEMQKTLVAAADSGQPHNFFDNLSSKGEIESDELASAMTAYPLYQGRRLGVSAMATVAIRQAWYFTGNRTGLSEQLAERMQLIDLDPKVERPGDRPPSMFKYDLDTHLPEHGLRYYYCLMVLVQNWINEGCPEWTGKTLNGFESHGKVIGGILEAAGLCGFLDNRDKLRSVVQSENPDAELMDALITAHNAPRKPNETGTLFRVFGKEKPPQTVKDANGKPMDYKYRGYRVVSIMSVLDSEQIARTGWGYLTGEEGVIAYPEKSKMKVAQGIAQMVGTVREWGEEQADTPDQQKRYVLTKEHKDKYGTLYRLDVLDPVSVAQGGRADASQEAA